MCTSNSALYLGLGPQSDPDVIEADYLPRWTDSGNQKSLIVLLSFGSNVWALLRALKLLYPVST